VAVAVEEDTLAELSDLIELDLDNKKDSDDDAAFEVLRILRRLR